MDANRLHNANLNSKPMPPSRPPPKNAISNSTTRNESKTGDDNDRDNSNENNDYDYDYDNDGSEQEAIPSLDDRNIKTLSSSDPKHSISTSMIRKKDIVLPSINELQADYEREYGWMDIDMLIKSSDDDSSIDLSVLTEHLIPPQYISREDDCIWDVESLTMKLSSLLDREERDACK